MPRANNLLVIMSDEHQARALSCAGHPIAKTPNLDRLAARGVRFADAYTPSPICVPARAAFASGRYVHDIRLWDNAIPYIGKPRGWGHALPESAPASNRSEDRNRLWEARHNAYYAGRALKPGSKGVVTDCCVPISALAECIARTKVEITRSGLIAPIVGHVGDGNLILIDPEDQAERAGMQTGGCGEPAGAPARGTVTGEHGIGMGKRKYMPAEHGSAYGLMARLKRAIDPDDIMNPGKLVHLD